MALYYNGIEFVDVNTTTHVMGPVKDPSGSDQLYTRINLQARTLLNVQLLPASIKDANKDAGGLLSRVRHMLTAPRKPMYYDLQTPPGLEFLKANNQSAIINLPTGRDDAGGPWPDPNAISITYTTPDTLEIIWACTVMLKDCDSPDPLRFFSEVDPPLSLRWEDSLSWDETWQATYHRSGTVIISSLSNRNIDWFRRNRLGIPVCAGFRRVRSRYLCSKDGLRCDFEFTDKQIRFGPPYPAVEMTITQSESAPTQGGMKKGSVAVEMRGIQNANVRDLASWALLIMKARVWASNKLQFQGVVPGIMNIETRETQDDVRAIATASYKVNPGGARTTGQIAKSTAWSILPLGLAGAVVGGIALITPPKPTQQGLDPVGTTPFPWIGWGTSPRTDQNPIGYAVWADPTTAIAGEVDGIGLASSISLFANLLRDPCGGYVSTTPNAINPIDIDISGNPTQPNTNPFRGVFGNLLPPNTNTPQGGAGGTPPFTEATLEGAVSHLNAANYPTTLVSTDNQGLIVWDGQPAVYDFWQCLNEYVDGPGVIVLPTADPDGINIRVDYGSPTLTLNKRWAAKRQGAPPTIPPKVVYLVEDPTEVDDNWVYVGGEAPQIRELGIGPNSVDIIYEATGVYTFQALDVCSVAFLAEIPPTLNYKALRTPSQWVNDTLQPCSVNPVPPDPNETSPGTPGVPTNSAPTGSGTIGLPGSGSSSPGNVVPGTTTDLIGGPGLGAPFRNPFSDMRLSTSPLGSGTLTNPAP